MTNILIGICAWISVLCVKSIFRIDEIVNLLEDIKENSEAKK